MYCVLLVRRANIHVWPDGYFPRMFHYKKDADGLLQSVRERGGEAKVVKSKKTLRK